MYVGRMVVVGMLSQPFAAYRVSSRSFPNRIAVEISGGASIRPLDPADLERSPYIAYDCIRVSTRGVVASNGTHTNAIAALLEEGATPEAAVRETLRAMGYERDEHNTPRIAGVVAGAVGTLGIVHSDGVEVLSFSLEPHRCRLVCTYGLGRFEERPCEADCEDAASVARDVIEGEPFRVFDHPVCSAAWMGGAVGVYNPHSGPAPVGGQ